MRAEAILDALLDMAPTVRYAALYPGRGEPVIRQRNELASPSAAESDRWEELLVNPALITLARQRGNIDCGGLEYLVVRYHHFFQLIIPIKYGHVSVCFDDTADPVAHAPHVRLLLEQHAAL
jgi:hypothetical protein